MDKATTDLLILLRDALSVADQAGEHMIAAQIMLPLEVLESRAAGIPKLDFDG